MTAGAFNSSHNSAGEDRPARSSYFHTVATYWETLYEDRHLTARIYQERKDTTLAWISEFQLPAGARVLDGLWGRTHGSRAC